MVEGRSPYTRLLFSESTKVPSAKSINCPGGLPGFVNFAGLNVKSVRGSIYNRVFDLGFHFNADVLA